MKPFTIEKPGSLLKELFSRFSDQKKTRIRQLLQHGTVLVNGKQITLHSHPLKPGDKVSFLTVKESKSIEQKASLPFRIVHEDEDLLVVEKPEGLLTISTETERENTLYFAVTDYVRSTHPARRGRVFIVHRLDRETSGLLVFAKKEEIKQALQENWKQVMKEYTAVVEGIPEKKEETLRSRLKEDKFRRVYEAGESDQRAQEAMTAYRTLSSGNGFSLLQVRLLTGRKNQIRVHLASIGHPVAGDFKYGAQSDPIGRLALHASKLEFVHPSTGARLQFRSPAPDEFGALVKRS